MLNDKIKGHDFQKKILMRAAAENIVSHSYLFSGPDGVGKRLIALEFAKLLNCLNRNSADSTSSDFGTCNCGSCKKVEKGIHPDVVYVQYEGVKSIKVEQVREGIEDMLFLKSFEGKFKVVIVNEAERMSNGAQNAFLKTLEEPPPYSVIILITSNPDSLLPTIRSRCQIIRFSALSEELIFEELKKRDDLSAEEALICSKLSNGSLGRALMLDSDIIEWRKELILYVMHLKPYSALRVLGLAESMPLSSNPDDMEKLNLTFEFISLWLRDLMLIKMDSDKKVLTNIDLIEQSMEIAEKWDIDNIIDKINDVQNTWRDIYHLNANKQLSFENLFIRISS
ncbi:MAG: DNA polymerase III subunit delta' [Thermodesulfobacteriota bacterium]